MTRASVGRMLRTGSRATVVLEFAIVGPVLFLVTFGAIDLGMILWTQGALQAVAADAARCGAIGASACSGSNTVQTYAQTEAADWLTSAMTTGLTVKLNGAVNAASCPSISVGTYETVEITTTYLTAWLQGAFANYKIDVCASYAD
jgi:Flp pilus assembly protein TadG